MVVALVPAVKTAVGFDKTRLHTMSGAKERLAAPGTTTALARIVVMVVRAATAISVAVTATDTRAAGTKKNFTEGAGVEE